MAKASNEIATWKKRMGDSFSRHLHDFERVRLPLKSMIATLIETQAFVHQYR